MHHEPHPRIIDSNPAGPSFSRFLRQGGDFDFGGCPIHARFVRLRWDSHNRPHPVSLRPIPAAKPRPRLLPTGRALGSSVFPNPFKIRDLAEAP